jgi:hypothetical protein
LQLDHSFYSNCDVTRDNGFLLGLTIWNRSIHSRQFRSVNCGNSYGDNGFNFRQFASCFLQDCKHNSKIIKVIVILFFICIPKLSSLINTNRSTLFWAIAFVIDSELPNEITKSGMLAFQ